MKKKAPGKIIFTFSSIVYTYNKDNVSAFKGMADLIHSEDIPVNWKMDYEFALSVKDILYEYNRQYGDQIIISRGKESFQDWRREFPWMEKLITASYRPDKDTLEAEKSSGVEGIWGYCDFQNGTDNITHWGTPWGMFRLSEKVPFIPSSSEDSEIIGIPWTVRDVHKGFHLGQSINFCTDPMEIVRSRTLCDDSHITFFHELLDEMILNTQWNDRVYFCVQEEANNIFLDEGQEHTLEGASKENTETMKSLLIRLIRAVKESGASVMTLPEAIADYKATSNNGVIPSTLLTTDKYHGSIYYYVMPFPRGSKPNEMGFAGHFPDSVFHFDKDCMLIFDQPSVTPHTVLNYKAQYDVLPGRPYPVEPNLPNLYGWDVRREGDIKQYTYSFTSWYSMPFGFVEWGNFENWEVCDSNCLEVKILNDRAMFARFNIEVDRKSDLDANVEMANGYRVWVRLKRKKAL